MAQPNLEISNSGPWVGDHARRRLAYREWLTQYDWEWFVTFTSAHGESREKIKRIAATTINRLGRELFGRRWYKQRPEPLLSVVALEGNGLVRHHAHMLLLATGGPIRSRDLDFALRFAQARLGHTDATRVTCPNQVVQYITKFEGRGAEILPSKGCRYNKNAIGLDSAGAVPLQDVGNESTLRAPCR